MNLPTVPVPAPAPHWLRSLSDARAAYQELLGWPVSVQVGQQNLVVATGHVLDAVAVPAALGAALRAQLEIAILAAPIIANADGTRWTFLSRPDGPIRHSVLDGLVEAEVHVAPAGSYLVVPTAMTAGVERAERWVEAPQPNRPLPPSPAVLSTLRRLTDRAAHTDLRAA